MEIVAWLTHRYIMHEWHYPFENKEMIDDKKAFPSERLIFSSGSLLLEPTQISQYLVLGNAFNLQAGYLFKSDWSLDLKYGRSYYEFEKVNSILQNYDSMGAGITKYFSNRAVKAQLLASYVNFPEISQNNFLNIECLFQIKF